MPHITNMANVLLDETLKKKKGRRGEICPSITGGDHLAICPLR